MVDHGAAPAFLVAAVRSFALDSGDCPAPPTSSGWVDRAEEDGVLAPVVAALQAARRPVPDAVSDYLLAVAARSLRLGGDLTRAAALLEAGGVPWVALKGPILASVVYESRHCRDYVDLDILVPRRSLRRSVELLVAGGAEIAGVAWDHPAWSRAGEVPLRMPSGVAIDLHWHWVNRPMFRRNYRLPMDQVLDRRVLREVDAMSVPSPDDLDLTLHVLLHACLDGVPLRNLLDAQQCIRWLSRRHEPHHLAERAASLGLSAAARRVLLTSARFLDPSIQVWADAMGREPVWGRTIHGVGRWLPPEQVTTGLTRRLTRHVAPSTLQSSRALAERLAERIGLAGRPDPQVDVRPTRLRDPAFQRWLDYVESA